MEAQEINKEIAKIIYGKDIVIDDEHGLRVSSKERLLESLRAGLIKAEDIIKGDTGSFYLEIPDYCSNIKSAIFLLNLMAQKCEVEIYNNYSISSGMIGWHAKFRKDDKWELIADEDMNKAICLAFIEFSKGCKLMQGKCSCGFNGEIVGYTLNVLDRKVNEYGLRCPQCEKFYHAYYSTTELELLKQAALTKNATRKEKRLYVREFNKLQAKYRKIYGTKEPEIGVKKNEPAQVS